MCEDSLPVTHYTGFLQIGRSRISNLIIFEPLLFGPRAPNAEVDKRLLPQDLGRGLNRFF
jgi:hypothetical protein